MKKFLFPVLACAYMSISGCGGEGYEMPCLKCEEEPSSSGGGVSLPSLSSSSFDFSISSSSSAYQGDCESVFNPSTHFCYEANVYPKCNGMEYNPKTHICQGAVANPAKCDGTQYNPLEQGCCGSAIYSLPSQRCQSGIVETKCGAGSNFHNPATQFCNGNDVLDKCGGSDYIPETQRCNNNVVEIKCGASWYNVANTDLRCESNVVETKCGASWYNAANTNLRCYSNVVETKCGTGSNFHNPATQFCNGNDVLNKCGGSDYNPATQFCNGNAVLYKCGGSDYNPVMQFCYSSTIYNKCNGQDYTPTIQRCQSNVVETKCGANWYNTVTKFCSNGDIKEYSFITYKGQTYKTVEIGSQTWMAENLNYAVAGSTCGDPVARKHEQFDGYYYVLTYENTEHCDKYGRFYRWSTAMALASNCNSISCEEQIEVQHQGICPDGWHIPSYEEWNMLANYVENANSCTSCVAKYLKAIIGWYDCGSSDSDNGYLCEDKYGFSALPSGSGGHIDSGGYFQGGGGYGSWWSASKNDNGNAYVWFTGSENFNWYDSYMSIHVINDGSFSVRCVQD